MSSSTFFCGVVVVGRTQGLLHATAMPSIPNPFSNMFVVGGKRIFESLKDEKRKEWHEMWRDGKGPDGRVVWNSLRFWILSKKL